MTSYCQQILFTTPLYKRIQIISAEQRFYLDRQHNPKIMRGSFGFCRHGSRSIFKHLLIDAKKENKGNSYQLPMSSEYLEPFQHKRRASLIEPLPVTRLQGTRNKMSLLSIDMVLLNTKQMAQ